MEGGNDTYISVVNGHYNTKAVKVRFLEAMNGQTVYEFNLYLAGNDHWSAVITDDPDGDGVRLVTADTSCTVPEIPDEGISFDDAGYMNDSVNGVSRTREGYIQIFEMGVVTDSELRWAAREFTRDCSEFFDAWGPNPDIWGAPPAQWEGDPTDGMSPNAGGLYGYGVLINVVDGINMTYRATALDDFSNTILHSAHDAEYPDLNSADPTSTVFVDDTPTIFYWSGTAPSPGINAVSSVLMALQLKNDYVLEPSINAGTDLLLTLPTRHHYTEEEGGPYDPFTESWDSSSSTSCEGTYFSIYNREGRGGSPDDVDFSSPPPGYPFSPPLCHESNLLTLNMSDVLHSSNRIRTNYDTGYDNGSVVFEFRDLSPNTEPTDRTLVSANGSIFHGLPVIGFAVQKYVNGDVGGLLSNYAGLVYHIITQDIDLP